ncbi:MAG: SURF1 family protein, partial [Pseudorhodoplanes sp.]
PPAAQWSSLSAASDEFRRVSLRVTFSPDADAAWLFSGASALREDVKAAGYFVFVPARLPDGRQIAVNRGFVPDRNVPLPAGTFDITGYLRWPQAASWFVASHDSTGETWLVRDPAGMAQARRWGEVAPFYIDQEAPLPPGGLPRPGPLTVRLKNDHLNYALTWFSLAGTLTAVFLLWLWRQRRSRRPAAS